ncbi:MAG: hypothetical protein K6E29_05410 [Cyanobacteria bacterium RUI128]|nr:hypothetical protein [Cyanobacteria bacterium RUI128]
MKVITLNGIKTGAKRISNSIREAEKDLRANVRNIREEIQEWREVGKVHKAGVTDDTVLEQLGPATKGLEDYAKANNINITFHTPQKPAEVGSNDFEKPLSITVYKDGFLNSYMTARTIDGDVSKVTQAKVELNQPNGKKVTANVEDSFLGRVYRTVSEMAGEINTKRQKNAEGRFCNIVNDELREEIRASHEQIREGIKDFFTSFVPKKKS